MEGSFKGVPTTQWLNSLDLKFIEPFEFVDFKNQTWKIPAETIVSSTLIPKVLWSIYGPPNMSPYFRSSFLYHHYLSLFKKDLTQNLSLGDIENMFYEACLTEGCEPLVATELYIASFIANWWDKKFQLSPSEFWLSEFSRQSQKYLTVFQDFCMLHSNELTKESTSEISDRLKVYLKTFLARSEAD